MSEDKREIIEILLWNELVHAKYWEQYISQYIGYKKDWRKRFSIATIALSVIGASSWKLWSMPGVGEWSTMIIFGLVAAFQVLSSIQKEVVIDNDTFQSLMKLRSLYIAYFNKLEHLFIDNENGLEREFVEERYFLLRETVYPIEELKDNINIPELTKVKEKGEKEVIKYLRTRYGISGE